MEDIYRVCGDRLNSYTEDDGWPPEFIPAFDTQAKMQKLVFDDVKYAFMSSLLPKSASRYSSGEWSVFYTAKHPITAIHEVAHHFRNEHKDNVHSVEYKNSSKVVYKIKANFKKQEVVPTDEKYLEPNTDGYPVCQDFAKKARDNGCCSLKATSVRHTGGICFPIFQDDVLIINPSLEHKFLLRWYCKDDRLVHFANGEEKEIALSA